MARGSVGGGKTQPIKRRCGGKYTCFPSTINNQVVWDQICLDFSPIATYYEYVWSSKKRQISGLIHITWAQVITLAISKLHPHLPHIKVILQAYIVRLRGSPAVCTTPAVDTAPSVQKTWKSQCTRWLVEICTAIMPDAYKYHWHYVGQRSKKCVFLPNQ